MVEQQAMGLSHDALGEAPAVVLAGDFAQNVTIIPTSISTLLLSVATLEDDEDRSVLMPYVETMVAGIKQGQLNEELYETQDFPTLMAATMPLDNALFFAWDMVRDIVLACGQLSELAGGKLQLEPVRLNYARNYAKSLQQQARECVAQLDRLVAAGGAAPGQPAPSRRRALRKPAATAKA